MEQELKDLALELKGKFDLSEKSIKAVEAKVAEITASVEKSFEEKKAEIEKAFNEEVTSLKSQITNITDRADALEAKMAKNKSTSVEKKSIGQLMTDYITDEVGGGDAKKGLNEMEKMLKSASGSFTIPINIKAVGDMTTALNLTGDPMISYASQQAILPSQKLNFRDLVPAVFSETGTYAQFEETGSEGSISKQTEGSTKSQIDYDLTENKTSIPYVAGFVTFTKQLMKNLPFLNQTLTRMLLRDFYKAENASFFSTVSAAAAGSTTVTATNDIEEILQLIANQGTANYNASYGLVSYAQMARLQIATFGKGYYSGAGGVQVGPTSLNVGGLPVIPASWVTDDKILIIDRDYIERVEAESLNVTFSYENGSNFIQNKVTARIECQEAINLMIGESAIYADLGNIV